MKARAAEANEFRNNLVTLGGGAAGGLEKVGGDLFSSLDLFNSLPPGLLLAAGEGDGEVGGALGLRHGHPQQAVRGVAEGAAAGGGGEGPGHHPRSRLGRAGGLAFGLSWPQFNGQW